MKTELWLNHKIRFVEKSGEWWAVAKDVTDALGITNPTMTIRRIDEADKALTTIEGLNRSNEPVNILSEFGIYKLILTSRKKEARDFERWVFNVIKTLRQSTGLEGFEVFRMMDKEHQKAAMRKLCDGIDNPVPVSFIKANTIANKSISTKYGHPKMLKKDQMTPDMLVDREQVLADTVTLMIAKDTFKADWSVAEMVYAKHATRQVKTA